MVSSVSKNVHRGAYSSSAVICTQRQQPLWPHTSMSAMSMSLDGCKSAVTRVVRVYFKAYVSRQPCCYSNAASFAKLAPLRCSLQCSQRVSKAAAEAAQLPHHPLAPIYLHPAQAHTSATSPHTTIEGPCSATPAAQCPVPAKAYLVDGHVCMYARAILDCLYPHGEVAVVLPHKLHVQVLGERKPPMIRGQVRSANHKPHMPATTQATHDTMHRYTSAQHIHCMCTYAVLPSCGLHVTGQVPGNDWRMAASITPPLQACCGEVLHWRYLHTPSTP